MHKLIFNFPFENFRDEYIVSVYYFPFLSDSFFLLRYLLKECYHHAVRRLHKSLLLRQKHQMVHATCYLELKTLSRSSPSNGFWHFLEQYGFRYGDDRCRPLLPSEVIVILRNIPQESINMLSAKGFFIQEGYIMHYLPVPPNCLSVPDVSDGSSVMSSDYAISVLKKVMKQAYIIRSSRSGIPNFESSMIEANDLQVTVAEYLQVRDAAKASRDTDGRFSIKKDGKSLTQLQLEKLRTLFIRKGTGFSSRSIVTGDPYKGVGEIGLPFEIAQRITIEEKVSQHNLLQGYL
ncbi:hypothetical protein POM88_036629 [Heracleum sosnowskyi]|uniref:DNA-directed RNA polymerase n=1 Tax=Heracleum sosnowskyi TaxID=360622 RepID=A0AAD8HNJ3_9APIA|nr:hypothetical protein POM88_036629 [Heracleum sosnowskyi]